MKLRISATTRIVLSLVSLSTSFMLLASMIGLFPDRRADILDERTRLCEALAVNFSMLARHTDASTMETTFETIVNRNHEIVSLGVRKADGTLLIDIGDHLAVWMPTNGEGSTETQMVVPVYAKNDVWGTLEVLFVPIEAHGVAGVVARPEFRLAGFMSIVTLVSYYLYLRKVLRQLNPSKVIPGRVREAFDSLAEGLVVMDQHARVVLANRAFEQSSGRNLADLLGRNVSDLPFVVRDELTDSQFPWHETIATSKPVRGRLLALTNPAGETQTFLVSSAPILDEKGNNRGALASFEDVSKLERKKEELRVMVEHLHASTEHIKRQNQELEILATRDPLTGCFNRRSFLDRFDMAWKTANRHGQPLAAIMVDIDHFKSVNDKFGHSVGDEVLQKVAFVLRQSARETDYVCRFGGEEFAILLNNTDLEGAAVFAEKLRVAIQSLRLAQLSVTASIGVSDLGQHPRDPQELLDQADKCLYVAKRNGRNQVIRWDRVPADIVVDESQISRVSTTDLLQEEPSIPFNAVTALISALAYRDQETAAHSRRVADLSVIAAEGLLSLKDCFVLEIAALLHDIGKIGVPDSILLKPGPLTDDEWRLMRNHERIGVEIIRTSFNSPALTNIVEHHHNAYGGDQLSPGMLAGRAIPIGARLLAIADAFDAMVSERVYRKGRSQQEAFAELRRCKGQQFDPELVERFIRAIEARGHDQTPQAARMSREAALGIGTQIERLVSALDNQDLESIGVLSQRLCATARKYGATDVASVAEQLDASIHGECDLLEIMHTANELLDLCRSTQSCFLQVT